MATSTACRRSVTAASRSRQNFPTPPWHSRPRAVIASPRAACATVTAGVTRDARDSVTSATLRDANPIDAVTAKTNVISHTAHPASAVARCPACQRLAAQGGDDEGDQIGGHANGEK